MTNKYLANDDKVNQYGSLYKYPSKATKKVEEMPEVERIFRNISNY